MSISWCVPLVALSVFVSPLAAQDAAREALHGQLEAQTRAMSAAYARGDLQAVSRYYADDATIYKPGGQVVRGRRAIDAFWREIDRPLDWRMMTVDFGGSLNEAFQLVESVLRESHEGKVSTARTWCLMLWRRAPGGQWRIVADMYTPVRRQDS
jgi:ketosteroid isomerase-like protein